VERAKAIFLEVGLGVVVDRDNDEQRRRRHKPNAIGVLRETKVMRTHNTMRGRAC
jgi:hypothetical protein